MEQGGHLCSDATAMRALVMTLLYVLESSGVSSGKFWSSGKFFSMVKYKAVSFSFSLHLQHTGSHELSIAFSSHSAPSQSPGFLKRNCGLQSMEWQRVEALDSLQRGVKMQLREEGSDALVG